MRRPIVSFLAIFLILFQIFISYPIAIWVQNKENFEAGLTSAFLVFTAVLLLTVAGSYILTYICPKKNPQSYYSIFHPCGCGIVYSAKFIVMGLRDIGWR